MPPKTVKRKVMVPEHLIDNFDRPLHRLAMFPGYTTLAAPAPSKEPVRRRATIDAGTRQSMRSSSSSALRGPGSIMQHVESNSPTARAKAVAVDVEACALAAHHHLTMYEVKKIKKQFELEGFGKGDKVGLNKNELHSVLCHVFNVKKVDDTVLEQAYEASQTNAGAVLDKFLNWYIQHMFCEVRDLNAEVERNMSEKLVYRLAQKFHVSPLVIDKIKKQFDHYDTDGSGEIEFSEFQDMFCVIVKAKKKADLNDKQIQKFWREIDKDGSGGVDFEEFVEWYLKYFDSDSEGVDGFNMLSPMEQFYDTFDPTLQRRNSFQMMRRSTTED
eukprot:gnl/TRDRNA2_/TRDRNA2_58087_c0_seq1.p1 gnl/TRDRNA2_/TRDRNA2_58087_c0~~gnl/TRDRNA2_/TRDRNA2_58087_c0_seq1.p1  ORF type:complete len:343 (-),score=83.73 gnl/TRDRNA2_/TRDRNA2_58087_c0_seq1:63-1049(-)